MDDELDLRATIARLEAEVTDLRAKVEAVLPPSSAAVGSSLADAEAPRLADAASSPNPRADVVRTDRRGLLRHAGSAAAGAVAGAVVLGQASPAAAAIADTGNPAIKGTASPTSGIGVQGITVSGAGVEGITSGAPTIVTVGVLGRATATSSPNVGVLGHTQSTAGTGVSGQSTNSSGSPTGVAGSVLSSGGVGVRGYGGPLGGTGVHATATTAQGIAVKAESQGPQLLLAGTPANPTTGGAARAKGEVVFDASGDLWICVAGGTPGTWRRVAGPATAGALVALSTTKRVYDSRPGQAPAGIGPKTPLAANTPRTVDLKANSSGVPTGATAVLVSLVATGTTTGVGGFMTIYRNGVAWPGTSNLNWSGAGQTVAVTTITAVDTAGLCALYAGSVTDVVVDVLGYYR